MDTRPSLSREQSRAVDEIAFREFHIPGIVLMENAGRGSAELLAAQKPRRVLVCCGPGNNGGDGYVIARHLDLMQIPSTIVRFCPEERIQGDALTNYRIVHAAGLEIIDGCSVPGQVRFEHLLAEVDWVVDALLGTGVTSPPREPIATAIRQINQSPAHVLAVDIPSGLNCDSGAANDPTVKADLTVTFVTPKLGYAKPQAQQHLGRLHVLDIGTPRALLERVFASAG